MPTSQPSLDSGKPRLRGDIYLRAEQRRRAEMAAAHLTEIVTPAVPSAFVAHRARPDTTTASVTTTATTIGSAVRVHVAVASATAESQDPVDLTGNFIPAPNQLLAADADADAFPTFTLDDINEFVSENVIAAPAAAVEQLPPQSSFVFVPPPAPPAVVAAAAPVPRHVQRRSSPSTMVVGTAAVTAALAIAGLWWLPGAAEAPAISRPAAAPDTTTPSAPASAIEPTKGPARTDIAAATPAITTAPPAATPAPRPIEPVLPAAATSGPVTPVSTASEGQLRITSTPPGARVTVNGIGWGQTPITIGHLPLGPKTVRITRDGYVSQQRVVDLRSEDASAALNVTLQRDR